MTTFASFDPQPAPKVAAASAENDFGSFVHTSNAKDFVNIFIPVEGASSSAAAGLDTAQQLSTEVPHITYNHVPVGTRVLLRTAAEVKASFGSDFYDESAVLPLCGFRHIGVVISSRTKTLRVRFSLSMDSAAGGSHGVPSAKSSPTASASPTPSNLSRNPSSLKEAPMGVGVGSSSSLLLVQPETTTTLAPGLSSSPSLARTKASALGATDNTNVTLTVTLPISAVVTLCDFLLAPYWRDLAALANQQKCSEMDALVTRALGDLNGVAAGKGGGEEGSSSSLLRTLADLVPPSMQIYLNEPVIAPVLCLKALCQLSSNNPSEALQTAASAVARDPTCAEAYLRVAESLVLLNRVEEAVLVCATAVANCGSIDLICDELRAVWLTVRVMHFCRGRLSPDIEVLPAMQHLRGVAGGVSWCHPLLRRQVTRSENSKWGGGEEPAAHVGRSVRCWATQKTDTGAPLLCDSASVLLTRGISLPSASSLRSTSAASTAADRAYVEGLNAGESVAVVDCGYCGFPLRMSKEEIIREVSGFSSQLANLVRKKYTAREAWICEGGCGTVFCSEVCRTKAYLEYHELECALPSRTTIVCGPVQTRRRTVDFGQVAIGSPSSHQSSGSEQQRSNSIMVQFMENSFSPQHATTTVGPTSFDSGAVTVVGGGTRSSFTGSFNNPPISLSDSHGQLVAISNDRLPSIDIQAMASSTIENNPAGSPGTRVPVKPKLPNPAFVAMIEARRSSVTMSGSAKTVDGIRKAFTTLMSHVASGSPVRSVTDDHASNSLLLFARALTTVLTIFFPCPLSMIMIGPQAGAPAPGTSAAPFIEKVVQNERQAQSRGISVDRVDIIKNIIRRCDEYGIHCSHGFDSDFRHTFKNLRSEDAMARSSGILQMNDVDRNSLLLAEIVFQEVGIPFFSNPFIAPSSSSKSTAEGAISPRALLALSPALLHLHAESIDRSSLQHAFSIAEAFVANVEEAVFSSCANQSIAFSSHSLATQVPSGSLSEIDPSQCSTPSRLDSRATATPFSRSPVNALLGVMASGIRRSSSVWTVDEECPAADATAAPNVWRIGRLLAFLRSPVFVRELWDLAVTGQVVVRRSPLRAAVGPCIPQHLHEKWTAVCEKLRTAHVALCPVLSTTSYLTYGRGEYDALAIPCRFPRPAPLVSTLKSTRSVGLLSISSAHDLSIDGRNSPSTQSQGNEQHGQGNIELDDMYPLSAAPGSRSIRALATRTILPFEEVIMEVA